MLVICLQHNDNGPLVLGMTHRAGGLAQRHVGLNHLKHVGRDLIQVLNLPDAERHHRPVILADQTDSIRETE